MASLAIEVTGSNASGPGFFNVSINVSWVDEQGAGRSAGVDLLVPVTASAEVINAAIRARAIDLAAAHGAVVGPTDVVRAFGGAAPNIS